MNLRQHHMLLLIVAGLSAALYVTSACAGKGLSQNDYKKLLGQALDEVSNRTPIEARRRIEFGMNLFIAHEAWIDDRLNALGPCLIEKGHPQAFRVVFSGHPSILPCLPLAGTGGIEFA